MKSSARETLDNEESASQTCCEMVILRNFIPLRVVFRVVSDAFSMLNLMNLATRRQDYEVGRPQSNLIFYFALRKRQ